jgi:hypothetical protein
VVLLSTLAGFHPQTSKYHANLTLEISHEFKAPTNSTIQ